MESQAELEIKIGTTEQERNTLQPAKVKIVESKVEQVGKNNNEKVVCSVKHPDKEETIKISSISYLRDKTVTTTGLWFNKDKEEKIQKGSALAVFLEKTNSKNLKELAGKEVDTELDGNFLCFKAY